MRNQHTTHMLKHTTHARQDWGKSLRTIEMDLPSRIQSAPSRRKYRTGLVWQDIRPHIPQKSVRFEAVEWATSGREQKRDGGPPSGLSP